ncbi:MAG: hypothetical protein SVU69_00070 [Pseudomonadota bacterium]|nr:hypothetical protein [Pseudomonadota bacterium]
MLVFKVVDKNKNPVKKTKVTVKVTDGGDATAWTDKQGFVAQPITGGQHGKVLINGKEVYEGPLYVDEIVADI